MANKTVTVRPSGGNYATLAAALAGEAADLTSGSYYEGGPGILNIVVEGAWENVDSAAVMISGYTTSNAYYINCYTDASNRAAASGWKTDRYRLSVSNATAISLREDNVRFNGFQIEVPAVVADDNNCFEITNIVAGGDIRFTNCRFRGAGDSVYHQRGIINSDADSVIKIWNCIFTGFANDANSAAVRTAGVVDIYNSLAYGNQAGFVRTAGTVSIYDSVSFENVDDFVSASLIIDYCASDDNDGTNNVDETAGGKTWADSFEDPANGDFRLKVGSPLIGAGGKAGSGTFSDDIDGTTRGAAWDVGPHEYVAAGPSETNILYMLFES